MVKQRTPTPAGKLVTADRAARLYRLLSLLGRGPQARETLTRRLGLNVRGFYRDLATLQTLGIAITLAARGYKLEGHLNEALTRLPFPDPGLTFAEAQQLAKGRTAAHRKLKHLIDQIVK
jgi:predicted DNA-binding transcriptional regulator YafY